MTTERSLNSGHVVSVCKQLVNRGVIGFRVCFFMPAPIVLKKLPESNQMLEVVKA